jgi:hypothetical protein
LNGRTFAKMKKIKVLLLLIPVGLLLMTFAKTIWRSAFPLKSHTKSCSWSFLRYEPSPFEEKWMEITKNNPTGQSMCNDIHSEKHSAETYELVRITLDMAAKKSPDPSKFHYFSKMFYKQDCADGSSKVFPRF